MFKDDRMISILTGILLMVLVGTVLQRADGLSEYLGSSEPEAPAAAVIALTGDVVTIPADALARIDVLSNDVGLTPMDRASLSVAKVPACGRVFVQAGALQYLSDASCAGVQTLSYSVQVGGAELVADVRINVTGTTARPVSTAQQPQLVQGETGQDAPIRAEPPQQSGQSGTASDAEASRQVVEPEPARPPVAGSGETLLAAAPAKPQSTPRAEPRVVYRNAPVKTQEPADPAQPAVLDTRSLGGADRAAGQRDQLQSATSPPATAPVAPGHDDAAGLPAQPDPVHVATVPTLAASAPSPQQPFRLASNAHADQPTAGGDPGALQGPSADGQPDGGVTDFLIALVELREPVTTPPAPLDNVQAVLLEAVPKISGLQSGRGVQVASLELSGKLSEPVGPKGALQLPPVDLEQVAFVPANRASEPLFGPALDGDQAAPTASAAKEEIQVARLDPSQTGGRPKAPEAPLSAPVPAIKRQAIEQAPVEQTPVAEPAPCDTPPSTTLDVRRAGQTYVGVIAPCQAGSVAELTYSGLSFAITLDGEGKGQILALGFEANAPALLRFSNGQSVDFDLPFKGMNRVSRVALVWDLPVTLELNALEFGAHTGAAGHVSPQNPRSFDVIRRSGGGFLTSYRSAYGTGQNAEIYTHYLRRGGEAGIVKMMIDFASRNRDRLEGTCGSGSYSAPQFMVVRSDRGKLDRPVIRRLAALDCSRVTEEIGDKRLISSAVADLIISTN